MNDNGTSSNTALDIQMLSKPDPNLIEEGFKVHEIEKLNYYTVEFFLFRTLIEIVFSKVRKFSSNILKLENIERVRNKNYEF